MNGKAVLCLRMFTGLNSEMPWEYLLKTEELVEGNKVIREERSLVESEFQVMKKCLKKKCATENPRNS